MNKMNDLAIDGGSPIRKTPFPVRALIGDEEREAVLNLFDRAQAQGDALQYNGAAEAQYEQEFADFMGGGFADGVNSGTNALFVSLGALQLDPFSEIIVPAISDPGGVMPVVMVGCVPVVADTDPRTYNMGAEQIEPMITERTKAIIVAHIGGEVADMDPIMELAASRGLYVIEDCAQCYGGLYKERHTGTFGDIAMFSTMFTKHYSTGGQGGVVFTKDEELYWKAKRFADRGKAFNLPDRTGEALAHVNTNLWDLSGNVTAGLNCNLNDLSAAIGSAQIKKLPEIIKRRRDVGDAVKEGLKSREAVSMMWQVPETKAAYWFMSLKLDATALRVGKAAFCKALEAEGIPAELDFKKMPSEMPWFRNKAVFGKTGFPWDCSDYLGPKEPVKKIDNALKVAEEHFTILIHENYGPDEIRDILDAIGKVEEAYLK
jgi:perosamine synthetase